MSGASRLVSLGPIHLPQLMEIERCSFASPWCEEDFLYWFGVEGALCLGFARADELTAYALGYCQDRDFHLTSLAVEPEFRRRGFAWELLHQMLRQAAARGAGKCTLEVRAANRVALELYAKAGFRSVERRVNHYNDPRDDGIIMERGIEIL